MSFLTNTDVTHFYSSFMNLDKQEYNDIIREYEGNKSIIDLLPVDLRIDIQMLYLDSLYSIGKYGVFLRQVDDTIEDIFRYNYKGSKEENPFLKLLLKKATALFQQDHIHEAEYVALELLKIKPEEPLYKSLLGRVFYKKSENRFRFIKTVSLALVFIAAVIYGVNITVVQYFTGGHYAVLFDLGFAILNMAILTFVVAEGLMFGFALWKAKRKAREFLAKKSIKK